MGQPQRYSINHLSRVFERNPCNLAPYANMFTVSVAGGPWMVVCTTICGGAWGRPGATPGDILSYFLGIKAGREISKEQILLRPFGIGTEIITTEQYDRMVDTDTLSEDAHYMVTFDETSVNHVDDHGRVIKMGQTPFVAPPEGVSEMTFPDLLKNQSVVWLQGRPPPEALEWAEEELARSRPAHIRDPSRERLPHEVYDPDECRPY